MPPDFKSLLQKPADSFKKPPTWPGGTYHGKVKLTEFGESSQKKTPYLRVIAQPYAAGEDVDQAALESLNIDMSKRTFRDDFYLTEDALYRLTEFMHTCGINTDGRSHMECIPEIGGSDVLITVLMKPTDDNTDFYNICDKIVGTAARPDGTPLEQES